MSKKSYRIAGNTRKSFIFSMLLTQIALFVVSPALVRAEVLVPIVVESGTNLIKLTEKFCTSRYHWKAVAKLNELKDPFLLYPGEKIMIPLELLKAESVFATVASVYGKVYLVRGNKLIKKLHKGDKIYPGQSVVTEEEGYAHLVFPDQRYTRIASDSKFSLTYLVKVEDQGIKAEFYLEKGRIAHNVKQHLKSTETFNTRTPVSVTGVRGTEYRIKLADKSTNIVETLRGAVSVSSQGESINVYQNEGIRVKQNLPPESPKALPQRPEVAELNSPFKVLPFRIPVPESSASDTYRYRLRIAQDKAGDYTVFDKINDDSDYYRISNMEDGKYFAFFTCIDHEGFESQPSGPVEFTLRTIPSAPILSNAFNGKTMFAEEVPLHWLEGKDVHHYVAELSPDETFSTIIARKETSKPELAFTQLEPGKYFARVLAVASDGFESLYSQVDSWIIAKSPDLAEISSSIEGGLDLRWAAVDDEMNYDLQVSKIESFSDILMDIKDLSEAHYKSSTELEPDTYYIRIRGVLPDGTRGPWTDAQKLNVPSGPFNWKHGVLLSVLAALIVII